MKVQAGNNIEYGTGDLQRLFGVSRVTVKVWRDKNKLKSNKFCRIGKDFRYDSVYIDGIVTGLKDGSIKSFP